LTSVFPVVLADALDRALAPKEDVVPEVTASTEFIAAEASGPSPPRHGIANYRPQTALPTKKT
jgi:hypothetical protein